MPEHHAFLRGLYGSILAVLRAGAKTVDGSSMRTFSSTSAEPQNRISGRLQLTLLSVGMVVLLGAALPGRTVETLVLQRKNGQELHRPMPLGQTVTTRYLHSVERTPVDDIYYAMGQRLWQWRTLTRSHNAGLPWQAPKLGRFTTEGPWLVLEGGRLFWEAMRLRVGDDLLGRNELFIGTEPPLLLYQRFAGESLRFSVERLPLAKPLFNDLAPEGEMFSIYNFE